MERQKVSIIGVAFAMTSGLLVALAFLNIPKLRPDFFMYSILLAFLILIASVTAKNKVKIDVRKGYIAK